MANPDLKWETTITRNLGLDFTVLGGKLNGTIEAYLNTTTDLLIQFPVGGTGYDTQYRNMGKTENKGIEASINWTIVNKKDWGVSFNANIGFNKNTSRKEVVRRIRENTIEEILNKVPVHKGDSFFIPAGTVHAIGAGCFICEIQQTSNVTYRLYDYGRLDRDGSPRPLQIKKALDVLDYQQLHVSQDEQSGLYHIGTASSKMLARTNWFTVTKYDVDGDLQISVMRSPYSLYKAFVVVDGDGVVFAPEGRKYIRVGTTWLLKQQAPLRISGHCSVLIINL